MCSTEAGSQPGNVRKNRYKDVLPCKSGLQGGEPLCTPTPPQTLSPPDPRHFLPKPDWVTAQWDTFVGSLLGARGEGEGGGRAPFSTSFHPEGWQGLDAPVNSKFHVSHLS